MPRRKKNAVRRGHGVMCNICGLNCGRGGALKKHIEGQEARGGHEVAYEAYQKCFDKEHILIDSWDDSVKTHRKNTVLTHAVVWRFVAHPGPRGIARAPRSWRRGK